MTTSSLRPMTMCITFMTMVSNCHEGVCHKILSPSVLVMEGLLRVRAIEMHYQKLQDSAQGP